MTSSDDGQPKAPARARRSAVAMFFTVGLLACGGPGGTSATVPSPSFEPDREQPAGGAGRRA